MTKNKEIVFKVPEFPHLSETFIIAQIVTAIKLGYKVKIVTRKLIKNTTLIAPIIFEYNLLDAVIIDDYKIPKNKLIRLLYWSLILLRNMLHLNSIINYHREFSTFSLTWLYEWRFYAQFNDAAVIHVQYGTYSHPYRNINNNTIFKPKTIVTFHGHDAFFPLYGRISNEGYYEKLFNNGTLITVNTPYLEKKLIGLGCSNEKLKIIPVSVNTEFFYPVQIKKEDGKTLKLINVARLNKFKGQKYCIKVIDILIKKGIDVSLTIIGEGDERKELEKLIADYKLEEKIFLVGKKSQEEVRQALWEHDIYLLTGVASTSGIRESQGLATLEAQACGLPAIAFDSGGIKYTIQDGITGFICKEFDVNAVAEKIQLFHQNRSLVKEMGTQARIFVSKEYAQNVIDERWKVIYESLIEQKTVSN